MVFVGQVYAVAGLLGAVVHVALRHTDVSDGVRVWVPVVIVVAIRAIAIRLDLHLPRTGRKQVSASKKQSN
jgi:uncharacterized membrane protein YeiH